MYPYKIGDMVSVNNYPFISKEEKKQIRKEGAEEQHSLFYEGKPRYGVVVGAGGGKVHSIPIVQITSHDGKTEKEGYRLRHDEVRVPQNIFYKDKNGNDKELYGVIKMERIETFGFDEISGSLASVPLRIKEEMMMRYQYISDKPNYKSDLDRQMPTHKNIMYKYKEELVAEKLHFFSSEDGENEFGEKRHDKFFVDKIQYLGEPRGLHLYSVQLAGMKGVYDHTIATRKSPDQVCQSWDENKRGIEWLREDMKFHALMKNVDQRIRPDPVPHPDKYVSIEYFRQQNEQSKSNKSNYIKPKEYER